MSLPVPIVFGPQVCGSLHPGGGADHEWLVTDGLGGYAMGTVSGLRTRRYHGALVTCPDGPAARRVGLAALDPVLTLPSGAVVQLGCRQWRSGAVAPDGHRHLERFDLTDGLPRWRWRVGDVVVERELALEYGRSSLGVVFRVLAAPAGVTVGLAVEALCTWRDAHRERSAAAGPLSTTPAADGVVVERAYRIAGPGWQRGGEWYLGAYHREEAARGLDPVEDLWYAGRFTADLAVGDVMEVSAWSTDVETRPAPATAVVARARARARQLVRTARPADPVDASLALAADKFVISGPAGPDVVAGYPWFGTWSRDTMISYEGLLLATGRADEGRELLRCYAATLSEGMLPNTADTGRTEYNTADATLWFLHAVDRHVTRTGDDDLAAELVDDLDAVLAAHVAGARYGLRVDPADGLLVQGAEGAALTWMDARVDGVPATQRAGKAVEINALWVNGLAAVAGLRERAGRDGSDLRARHDAARASFGKQFPADGGWLNDVVDAPPGDYPLGGGAIADDPALRPNQLLAFSLPYAPLAAAEHPAALRAVGAALLTPLGLRTLAPTEPGYTGAHRGGPGRRDAAYHMGTVWPWLIGPYVDACRAARLPTDGLFAGLEAHLAEWGLGSVSETADGDAPHAATGCPFQAWSVAELNRVRRNIR